MLPARSGRSSWRGPRSAGQDHRRKLGAAQAWGVPGRTAHRSRGDRASSSRSLDPRRDPRRVSRAVSTGSASRCASSRAMLRDGGGHGAPTPHARPGHRSPASTSAPAELHGVGHRRAGTIATPRAVVCGGIWGPLLGDMLRTPVPLTPCEHLYAITTPVAAAGRRDARGRPPDGPRPGPGDVLPPARATATASGRTSTTRCSSTRPTSAATARRPGRACRTVNPHGETPRHAVADAVDGRRTSRRPGTTRVRLMPPLAATSLDLALNGMFSFTPDGFPVMGESPAVRGAWIAEAVWMTHGGGVGRVMADWITDGDPGFDVHEMHIDRFEPVQTLARLRARPRRPQLRRGLRPHPSAPAAGRGPAAAHRAVPRAARGARRRVLRGQGLRARPVVQRQPAATLGAARTGWAGQFWSASAATEHRATRERTAIFDLTSLTKATSSAVRMPRRSCSGSLTNDLSGPVGSVVYSAMCDASGGVKATSPSPGSPRTATSSAATGRRTSPTCAARAATTSGSRSSRRPPGSTAVLVTGPEARALLQSISPDDLSNDGVPVHDRPADRARRRAGPRPAHLVRRRARLGAVRRGRHRPAAVGRHLEGGRRRSGWSPPAGPRTTGCAWRRATARGAWT